MQLPPPPVPMGRRVAPARSKPLSLPTPIARPIAALPSNGERAGSDMLPVVIVAERATSGRRRRGIGKRRRGTTRPWLPVLAVMLGAPAAALIFWFITEVLLKQYSSV